MNNSTLNYVELELHLAVQSLAESEWPLPLRLSHMGATIRKLQPDDFPNTQPTIYTVFRLAEQAGPTGKPAVITLNVTPREEWTALLSLFDCSRFGEHYER